MNDNQYVEAFKSNDNVGIKQFYKESFVIARSFMHKNYSWMSNDDVKDVFQDSVISLWKNINEGKYTPSETTKLSTYLIQVCKFKILDRMKKKSNQMEISNTEMVERSDLADISTSEEDESAKKLQNILLKMPERCKSILMLYYFEKLKLNDIAIQLSIGQASIKNEKYRCMNKLKEMYTTI